MARSVKSNILVRTLSGIVLLGLVLAAVLASPYTFLALLLVIGIGSLAEFYRLAELSGAHVCRRLGFAAAVVTIVLFFLAGAGIIPQRWMALSLVPVSVLFAAQLWRRGNAPLADVSVAVGGLVYAALPMALFALVGFTGGVYEPWLVLAVIFTVWVNDIFAYLTGTLLGRHKLLERISPKKSWEGFVGGAVCAVAFAVFAGWGLAREETLWAGLGLTIVLGSVAGDLVESMFKRAAAVKDSGHIIPGHGGFLDRFDALLFCLPPVYVYFVVFEP